MTMPQRSRACAGVAAFDADGRLLLIRRKEESAWGLPGGGIDFGESWAECAVRECREETGYEVEVTNLLGVYSEPAEQVWVYPDAAMHFVGVVFRGRVTGGCCKPQPEEVVEITFAGRSELPELIWGPDLPVIRDAFSGEDGPFIR